MTLLTACQRVCDTVGMPRPNAVASSTDQLARMLFGLANDELEELSKARDWPVLQQEIEFDTVVGQYVYVLADGAVADDYRKLIGSTAYQVGQYRRIRGSLTPSQWQRQRQVSLAMLAGYGMRVGGSPVTVRLTPTPQVVETLVYEYMSSNFAVDNGGTRQPLFVLDTDSCLVDEAIFRAGLKWRIKHAKGLDYAEDYNQYLLMRERDYAGEIALDQINVGGLPLNDTPELGPGYVPENGYGP